jgi:hypothetical protein
MLKKQMCKERRKDREGQGKKRVLESFFFNHLLYKILGLKKLQQHNLFAKKVKKKNFKSLLPLNFKKCIMVKTWATYAP